MTDQPVIDPEAIYSLKESVALTGLRYHVLSHAIQSGRLPAERGKQWRYDIRGCDLIAWRQHRAMQSDRPSAEFLQLRSRLWVIVPSLTDDQMRSLVEFAEGLIGERPR